MKQRYSIGLDIGVGSVGWACITPDFKFLKYRGRHAIGTREFSSAQTAEERRLIRGMRRRYNRRVKRIQLLQETIAPLFQNDPTFFIRTSDDRKHFWRNSNEFERRTLSEVLTGLGLNSRHYPTIYHLRYALLTEKQQFDPKLIYLALHHLVKFRGHFLNEHMNWTSSESNETIANQLMLFFEKHASHHDGKPVTQEQISHVEKWMKDDQFTKSDKRREIVKVIGKEYQPYISLLIGLNADVAKLFPHSENVTTYTKEKLKIDFSKEDYSEVYESLLNEEKIVIDEANTIYQNILLHELLDGAATVAEAKVKSYKKFGEDLKRLKHLYNEIYDEKKYREMFITSRESWRKYNEKRENKVLSHFDRFLKVKSDFGSQFYNQVKKDLKDALENGIEDSNVANEVQKVIDEIDRDQFLQKQKSHANSAIPHQNNVYEAEQILRNQQEFYSEITDEMIDRVKDIIQFRIPYYIGPLVKNEHQSEFGWAIRKKDDVPLLPWNFTEVIDRSKSAEQFIQRMTNKCVYLTDEMVLPKQSLLYEKFEVLNELNGIQIRSKHDSPHPKHRLSKEVKDWIIENVFAKRKTVTIKTLINALKNSPFKEIILDSEIDGYKEIHGTQQEDRFSTSLSSYIDMCNIFGEVNEQNEKMIEEIIYWITVFEDKSIIDLKIKEKYPNVTKKQRRRLMNLPYSGWGRLSKKLLAELPVDQVNNLSMIELMERESKVFMEILTTEKYDLEERIATMNIQKEKDTVKIKYEDIAALQGSPALKKAIWQAVLIVEELVGIFGEPEHIMIEFAREEGEKGRTTDRKKRINEIQRKIPKKDRELKDFLKEHGNYEVNKYQDQRFYLYITQHGKCMYSGESLSLANLHEYEIDHIYPRNFVKDDSINNLALVKQKMNQAKGGTKMPLEILSASEQVKMKAFWTKLYENDLISQTKYHRLLKDQFTDQDKELFFARQLVETRQITKHVKDLLDERFEKTEVHTVNAEIVSKLRSHSGLTKIRSLNNKHHAVDAVLSALVVQFIINKYGHNFLDFDFRYQKAHRKWREMFKQYKKNFFLFHDIDKYDKFFHYETGELMSGRQFLSMINDEIPWQSTKKIGSEEGAFYKQMLYSPKVKTAKYVSSKTDKGVYVEMKNDSAFLISYKEENARGKIVAKSEFVDYYVFEKYQNRGLSEDQLAHFLAKKVASGKIVEAKIHTRIQKYQLVEIDDFPFYFISSSEMHNAKQLQLTVDVLHALYDVINDYDEEVDIDQLQQTFKQIAEEVAFQYETFLPENNRNKIRDYYVKIKDRDTFIKAFEELMKTTSASAARSTTFGYRYRRKVDPNHMKFVHTSITGLRRRRPRSYRNELWSL